MISADERTPVDRLRDMLSSCSRTGDQLGIRFRSVKDREKTK